jgi:hypothetical protein
MSKKVGCELTVEDCIRTKTGTPESLAMYAADVHGPEAMVNAVQDLIDGKEVEFAVCVRVPGTASPPVVKEIVRFVVPHYVRAVRYCDNMGNETESWSTVHGTGSMYEEGRYGEGDAALLTACLCHNLLPGDYWVYRTM